MRKTTGIQNKLISLLMMLLIVMGMIPEMTHVVRAAEEERVVRVGVYEMPGFCEKTEDGSYLGYGMDYLNLIANQTGWDYEYVEIQNFQSGITALDQHTIDILAPAQITDERIDKYQFSEYAIGTDYSVLITRADVDTYAYEDFDSLQGQKVAVSEPDLMTEYFFVYEAQNALTMDHVYYDSPEAAKAALHEGLVDVAVSSLMKVTEEEQVLARFNPKQIYFMTWKGNDEMLEELNQAMVELQNNKPSLVGDLTEQYYPIYKVSYLTEAQRQFVEELPVINMGYVTNRVPVSYTDPETGEFAGMSRQIMDRIQKLTGLKFNYIPLPADQSVTLEYLRTNNIRLVMGVEYNSVNLSTSGLYLSNPYLEMNKVMVGWDDVEFDKNAHMTVALNTGSVTIEKAMKTTYPNFELVRYESVESCFEAVEDREVDLVLLNQYNADYWLSKARYENLSTVPVEGIQDDNCISAMTFALDGQTEAEAAMLSAELINVLNVGISGLTENEVSAIIVNCAFSTKYHNTLGDFLYKYRFAMLALTFAVILIFAMMITNARLHSQNLKAEKARKAELESITNNINGGVLVMSDGNPKRVTYVNAGLLGMLGYTEAEREKILGQDYINLIYPDDIPKVIELESGYDRDGHQVSFPLRLLREDGAVVSTLFNGTYMTSPEQVKQLYCVIIDISERNAIQEKLEIEQQRFSLLVEQSQDIIFQLNFETGEVETGDMMMEKYGWTFPDSVVETDLRHISRMWQVHNKDRKLLDETFVQIVEQKHRKECIVRILGTDQLYHWVKVLRCPLCDSKGDVVSIVGRIQDMDSEMREKIRLEEKSRMDSMTGLQNKITFMMEVQKYLDEGRSGFALIFLDLDHFKTVNDKLGHLIGDQAIRDAADKLREIFRDCEYISRFGGDEFCILLNEAEENELREKLEIICEAMRQEYVSGEQKVTISASVGAAYAKSTIWDMQKVMAIADQAVYESKSKGRNQYTIIDV